MAAKIKILHLEDIERDALLIQSVLIKGEIEYEYYLVENETDFKASLQNGNIDIILSDYYLSDYSGIEALKYVKNNYSDIPFIFVSGNIGEEIAIESMKNGATDYVLKNKPLWIENP